ncbi:MAG: histidine kinase [Clostridia bacterium]|nr:histidine kinase [Clostridia bacterium]
MKTKDSLFPYQQALRRHLFHSTLKPVLLIGLCVIIGLPIVLTGVLTARAGRLCLKNAEALEEREGRSLAALETLRADEAIVRFVRTGEGSVQAYEQLYALRNRLTPGARFELVSLDGRFCACDLRSDYSAATDILLLTELQKADGAIFVPRLLKSYEAETPVALMSVGVMDGEEMAGVLSLILTGDYLNGVLGRDTGRIILTADSGRIFYEHGAMGGALGTRFAPRTYLASIVGYRDSVYIAQSRSVESLGIGVHLLISFDYILPVIGISILFVMALVGIMALLTRRVSYQAATGPLLEPFDKLFLALKQYGEGNTLVRISVDSADEMSTYLSEFNAVLDEIDKLLARNRELERVNALAERKILEAQFNPHFMFNMLEMIKYTIHEDPDRAVRMVLTLAQMLRYSLDIHSAETPLEEDLTYLRSYLDMQALRLGERFTYEIRCEDDLKRCPIPKLIMQPVVENAVKYGYTGAKPFRIEIDIRRLSADRLNIVIANNGPAIKEKELRLLQLALLEGTQPSGHIGLYNTHRRLQLAFGKEAGLTLQSGPEETAVTLRLRMVKTEGSP